MLDFATAYSYFTYDEEKGVYVFVEDPDESYEISFLDNKLVFCKIFLGTGADVEIWTTSYSDVGETLIFIRNNNYRKRTEIKCSASLSLYFCPSFYRF